MRQTLRLQSANPIAVSKPAPGAPRGTFQPRIPQSGLVSTVLLVGLVALIADVAHGQDAASKNERDLIAVLRSDAPKAEKAIACKNLSVYGSSEAVADLAKLLGDEQLASWSRTALEAIPGAAVDEALRTATKSLEGKLLAGTINSIGVRRDAGAVDLLSKRLADKDAEVASAAAVALGRIGNAEAARPLRQALTTAGADSRSAVAEGCVLCAERFLAAGNAAEAAKIYDEVRKAEVPRQRMLEATRGAILARGQEGVPLLLEQLRSTDKGLFQIGLGTAREFPGRAVDGALGAELDRAPPERAALIIVAMADRKESVDLAAVLKAAQRGPALVRVAAVSALGRVGDASCLAPLLDIAIESDADLAQAAKAALADLPGQAVDKAIVAQLATAEGKIYPVLIELVGQRRIDATADLRKALSHPDRAVRSAALTALGNTVNDKYLSLLVAQVVEPPSSDNAAIAQAALKTAAVRMPDREACAAELATALNRAPAPTKGVLLDILAAVGGMKALAAVGAAAKSPDPALQDVASRLLGEWMTIDAAPVLLDLAKTGDKFQVRALRGYIRIARQFTMGEQQRVEMCKSALDAARQPAERKLVLEVLQRYPNLEMLKLAVKAAQTPELKEDAKVAALAISQKLGRSDEARKILSQAGLEK
jgi:HEAT repeat protein